jgi:outer membrane protein insertion porin family
LEKEVPFLENEEVTDESVSETVSRIRSRYLDKGYYYVSIAAGVERTEDVIRVSFIIFEGEKVYLKEVEFKGMSADYESLKMLAAFKEGKPYNENQLNKSREDLARFYNALGFLDFEVKEIKKKFNAEGSEVSLQFDIYEGPRTIIDSITVKGNMKLDTSRIMNAIQLKTGDPYNVIDISDARYRVLSLYRSRGYIDANIDVKDELDDNKAHVTFIITENKPSRIGKIIIRGNRSTKTYIIRREFTAKEGDLYNQQEITRVRQRLYQLGIFSEVTINMIDADMEYNDKNVRDILVSLKEGKAGTVELAVGYSDYEELRGSFDISYRNLGGYNRQVGFRTELSSVEERYVLNFVEPWFFDIRNLPLKMFLMKEITRSVNVETRDLIYKIDKFSFIAGFEKELINDLRVGLNYEYSFTNTSDVQPGIILSKEDSGTLGIGSISPSIFYDNRDDPFDPSSGSLHGIVMKFASQAFLSETEFMKVSFQSSWYFPAHKNIVFAFSVKAGAAYGFEGSNEVPLIERYFLGGRSTVRGYRNDALGPKDVAGNPTGGNIFALTNMEFRIPFWKGLGAVAFLDSGNVWRTADQIEPDLKHTIGGGIRYATPVGPVRVDYGYKLSRESDESVGELHFSFGHAF